MTGSNIRWWTENGVLLICSTPGICGNIRCSAPMEWNYVIQGDQLDLTSRQVAGLSFSYTRGLGEMPAPASEPASQQGTSSLEGTWLWLNTVYYVFEAGGGGTMAGSNMRWWTDNGVLFICSTPGICGNVRCSAPMEWNYVVQGNQLDLTSRQVAGLSFSYTRR